MNEYQAAKLDPFAPRQCFHWNSDGIRCRAFACHNEYTCFHHRCPDEPSIPIIANDPFTLPPLRTRHGIQDALDAIATLLAGKRIDDRRAKLLLYTIQLASNQLPRPTAATRPEAAANAESAPIHNQAPATDTAPLSVCHSDPEPREGEESPHFVEPPQNCHPERSPLSEPQASRMGAESKACPERSRRNPDTLHTASTAQTIPPSEFAVEVGHGHGVMQPVCFQPDVDDRDIASDRLEKRCRSTKRKCDQCGSSCVPSMVKPAICAGSGARASPGCDPPIESL